MHVPMGVCERVCMLRMVRSDKTQHNINTFIIIIILFSCARLARVLEMWNE